MTENASIIIAYDGSALEDNSMDVQELALALTGLGEVFQEANSIINQNKTITTVKVKADFQKGSFEISFEVLQQAVGYFDMFNNPGITGAKNLIELMGLAGVAISTTSFGLIQLIKRIRGRNISSIKEKEDKIIIYIEEEEIIISNQLYDLYTSTKVRKGLARILKPIESDGIDVLQIKNEKKEITDEVKKEEVHYFNIAPQQEILNETTSEEYLYIISLAFKDGNKWRFTNGELDFYATIKDEVFLYQINNNLISFSKSDTFKVSLKKIQWNTEEGLKTEYFVEKILDYKSAKQLKLDLYKNKEE